MQELELAKKIAQHLYDRKAQDILVLKVDHLMILTDYLVIATGTNPQHTKALKEYVDQEIGKFGISPRHIEGHNEGRWIVMDYLSAIVHIFSPEDRDFYRLERLWTDDSNHVVLPFEEESQGQD
ncbi:MAG: ribosome silencing factor [Clostridiales bacterium]|nr:ribosome silencing factor [Clostridiales bacterium]